MSIGGMGSHAPPMSLKCCKKLVMQQKINRELGSLTTENNLLLLATVIIVPLNSGLLLFGLGYYSCSQYVISYTLNLPYFFAFKILDFASSVTLSVTKSKILF